MTDTTSIATLDVRTIPPRDRHATIFSIFRDLRAHDALELINDHDPKPLYHQFQAEAPGSFGWDYLAQGTPEWRVRITKLPGTTRSSTCCGGCGGT